MQPLAGILIADAIYTVEGLESALGIGRVAQREGRRSGALKSFDFCKRKYYRGRDVIEWIESAGRQATRPVGRK